MQLQQLERELTTRAIVLSLEDTGKIRCNGPKGSLTPALVQAIKEHRESLLSALAGKSTEQDTPATQPLTQREQAARLLAALRQGGRRFTYTPQEKRLTVYHPGKTSAQERQDIKQRLMQFPAPVVLALVLEQQEQDTPAPPPAPTEQGRQRTERQAAASSYRAGPPSRAARTTGKGRATVYADVHQGRALTETGETVSFPPCCSLSELVHALTEQGRPCNRVYLCGQLPEEYAAWLIDTRMREEYTTGKRGHYFDKEKEENHVARYARRITGEEIEIRTMYAWFGDTAYTIEQAAAAMRLLEQYLHSRAYATPALTFQQLWLAENRIHGKHFPPLPEETRALIYGSTGQGRIELCTPETLEQIDGLYYYDGVLTYGALTWGMPTELELHDNENLYAGKVPARYRIRYTVPHNWQHIGLFMTPKEQVTGNERDSTAWCYPGEKEQGRTFETWADGSELDVAYHLPPSMPQWDITILERIIFKPEKDSTAKRPLDSITNKLVKMRERVEQDARQDTEKRAVYLLVRGAIRNILLHGIGSFHRKTRDVTYILRADEPAPDGYTALRDIDENTVWYTVPQETESYTQQFEHPEWAALVWARCRARMTRAALQLPRACLVAIRTDAIATSTEQPQWAKSEKVGTLRQKWSITKLLPAPHTFEALDALVHAHVRGDR